ncbi:hypothetical protein F5Y12DRAFT_735647 [Xylaria sp. FL1777]|nr:hypothetical protein F5Y12DRAFT_735647 [Xylaria sp. FL1777]
MMYSVTYAKPYPQSDSFVISKVQGNTHQASVSYMDAQFMTAKYLRFDRVGSSSFLFLLSHPLVERLEFLMCDWYDTFSFPEGQGPSAVREIELQYSYVSSDVIDCILRSFPRLRSLVYLRPWDEFQDEFGEIGTALCQFGQRLEHLTIRNESLLPFETDVKSLASLVNLKSLEIHLELLIGFRKVPHGGFDEYTDSPLLEGDPPDYDEIHESFGDWSFLKLLPTSLERLTIDIEPPKLSVYFNTYKRYGAKFDELICAERRFPKLEYIMAPELEEVAQRVRRRLTKWVYEDHALKRVQDTVSSARVTPVSEDEVSSARVTPVSEDEDEDEDEGDVSMTDRGEDDGDVSMTELGEDDA